MHGNWFRWNKNVRFSDCACTIPIERAHDEEKKQIFPMENIFRVSDSMHGG